MQRNMLFDSLKFGLIYLMVFGHTLQYNSGSIKDAIYGFIYSFHMPLFIFVSGYFSKNINLGKYKKSFISLIITFTIFQFIYSFPLLFLDFKEWLIFFVKPKGWYIIGLLVWRLLFLLAKDKFSKYSLLSLSFIFPLCIGFFDYEIPLFRIFTFFPYFLLGAYCRESTIFKIRDINKIYTIGFLIISFICMYFFVNGEFIVSLFGEAPYIEQDSSRITGLLYRILAYFLAIVVSIGVINLVPDTIGKYGSKTLEIYLMHHIFLYLLYVALFPFLHFHPGIVSNFGISALIIILCLYLSMFKVVKIIMAPLDYLNKIK